MTTIVVACNTMRDEIKLAAKELKVDYPIIWIDSGLHNVPEKLNKTIQDQVNRIENVQNILLLFGCCGNSLVGLCSPHSRIIVPRVDDCISLLLGGNEHRRSLEKEAASYYFTKGYLRNERSIWTEYNYCVNKYGQKKAKTLFRRMLNNYKRLVIIDTGAFNLTEIFEETNEIADEFELIHQVTKGSLKIIHKAFMEQWDEDFILVEPGKSIGWDDFRD